MKFNAILNNITVIL